MLSAQSQPAEYRPNYAQGLGPELERICEGIQNSERCALAIERYQLQRKAPGVVRSGPTLTITPTAAPPITFRESDRPDSPGDWYQYLKPLPEVGYHLIHIQHYEDQEFLLINATTGSKLQLRGRPVLSPDNVRFVAGWKTSPGSLCPSSGEVQIWKFTKAGPELEWKVDLTGYTPVTFEWRGATEVHITANEWRGLGDPDLTESDRQVLRALRITAPSIHSSEHSKQMQELVLGFHDGKWNVDRSLP